MNDFEKLRDSVFTESLHDAMKRLGTETLGRYEGVTFVETKKSWIQRYMAGAKANDFPFSKYGFLGERIYAWLRDPPHWFDDGMEEYRPRLGMHLKGSLTGDGKMKWHTWDSTLTWKAQYNWLRLNGNSIWQSLLKLYALKKVGAVAYNQEVKYYLW